MDADMPRIRLLKRYVDGDAPLPLGGANTRASWQRFQKESRTNWGLLIIEASADRLVPNGITVGGSPDSKEAVVAQRIWRTNRMDSVFKEWVRYGLTFRRGFMTVWKDEKTERAVIAADSPETMYVATDPLQPWRVRAALRVWRDEDAEKDYALVWTNGRRQKFSRSIYVTPESKRLVRRISGDWKPEQDAVETGQAPPVVVYNNPGGVGEFETHLDVINRINRGVLHRLVIEAMQSYRQRALRAKDGDTRLPDKDPEGKDIDWGKIFEPAPGAMWELPPGIDIWEAQPTDTRPLLDGSTSDIRHLASSTRTPLPMLMPDNANQSAKGATSADAGHLSKCGDRLAEARVGAAAVLVEALKIEDVELEATNALEVTFEPVEMVSVPEKFAAAAQAKAAGLPTKTIARKILGWSPAELAQLDVDRSDEMLFAATIAAVSSPAQTSPQQPQPATVKPPKPPKPQQNDPAPAA
ncbi:hypothetical protein B5566_02490 [Mycobacterium sp. MHSD3]|nr:hypothetical protein B5566_02490 [Mycobacterium sp. MHSD3]